MRQIALVCLDCATGRVNRYLRAPGNKPEKTGDAQFTDWNPALVEEGLWDRVWKWLQVFRVGYVPPEDQGPHPTPPLRRSQLRAAA